MRAYTLTSYGPDGLVAADVPEPTSGPGQVKIRVEQIAIDPLDWKIRNGYVADVLPLELPAVLGLSMAGTVLETGAGVDDLAPGDRVTGFADTGAYAEVTVSRRERVTPVPAGLDPVRAAAVATAAEAAQRVLGLVDGLGPGTGSTVVVNGAAGAVGSAVTQLLVARGHRVVGTAGPDNHDYLRRLGAEPVAYGATMLEEIRRAAPDGVDAGVDAAGRDFVARVADLLAPERIVTTVDFAAASRGAVVAGGDPRQLTASTVGTVLDAVASGSFQVEVDATYPFDRLAEALARSEAGHLRGKLVVSGPAS
ncbi:NADP-dependent oxidoreductase [Nocardioides sp. SOB77]|uniref:NADP-dependent oxidoreductase n=1 Tax=Nocardioides oceani TaxID=3058369 RepID=A0ABT8FDE4_9ACTN|nr:NADP-dependent oxidoreductase [Nocardioides oceani]MDN4172197.1 NADP-dependent oxidoreductase [Nocardioides oceani]